MAAAARSRDIGVVRDEVNHHARKQENPAGRYLRSGLPRRFVSSNQVVSSILHQHALLCISEEAGGNPASLTPVSYCMRLTEFTSYLVLRDFSLPHAHNAKFSSSPD